MWTHEKMCLKQEFIYPAIHSCVVQTPKMVEPKGMNMKIYIAHGLMTWESTGKRTGGIENSEENIPEEK